MIKLPKALSALSEYKQFVIWKKAPGRKGKTNKFTLHPQTMEVTDAHDPDIWVSFETAQRVAALNGKYVGFVLTANDPFFFLDVDDCLDDKNKWSPLADELIREYHMKQGAALELSQSGRGLHFIGSTRAPINHNICKVKRGYDLYTEKRFIALTGNTPFASYPEMPGSAGAIINPVALVEEFNRVAPAGANNPMEWTDEPVPEWHGYKQDKKLIEKMLKRDEAAGMLGKCTIRDLWERNEEKLAVRYPPDPNGRDPFNHSNADYALLAHLAYYTGKNCERMQKLFEKSALARDDGEKGALYQRDSILKMVALCTDVDGSKTHIPATTGGVTNFVTVEQQQQDTFKDMVLVKSSNTVVSPHENFELGKEQFNAIHGGAFYEMGSEQVKNSKHAWDAFIHNHAYRPVMVDYTDFKPSLPTGAVFEEEGLRYVNIYKKTPTISMKGDATPLLNHIKKLVPNARDREIFLSYLAAVVQYPGKKFHWTIFLQGVEGNGKSLIGKVIEKCIGFRHTHRPNPKDIDNKFNKWVLGKLFFIVEEVKASKDAMEGLKSLIDSERIEIQGKGDNQVTNWNYANSLFISNYQDGIITKNDTRRICPIFTAQQQYDDLVRDGMETGRDDDTVCDYFYDLFSWLEKDGYAICNDFLMNYDIPDKFNPATKCNRAPKTTSTETAVSSSMTLAEQEILNAIENNLQGFRGGYISSKSLSELNERKRLGLSRNKLSSTVRSFGYEHHPAFKDRGRTSVAQEGGRIRLYVRKDQDIGRSKTEVTEDYISLNHTAADEMSLLSKPPYQ